MLFCIVYLKKLKPQYFKYKEDVIQTIFVVLMLSNENNVLL